MKKTVLATIMTTAVMTGCAGFNDAMTPSVEIRNDKFTGETIVSQSPVSSAQSLSEGYNMMGFIWSSGRPDNVYVDAGVAMMTANIRKVTFKIGDELIECKLTSQIFTDFEYDGSYKQCYMSLGDFKISKANSVMMRVNTSKGHSTSSFGINSSAIVSSKLKPFLDAVKIHK